MNNIKIASKYSVDMGTRFPSVRQRVSAYKLYCKMWNKPCRFSNDELDDVFRFINTSFTPEFEAFVKEYDK